VNLDLLLLEALQLVLWLAAPALVACIAVAALTTLLQGKLQASDPSISFVPKLLAVCAALWLSHSFLAERISAFAGKVLGVMAQL
jgi:flagellar biosynthesis protein FliQ